MTGKKWFAWVVALAVTLPVVATAQDAPGVFKIPGTETTLKIYGFARFDMTYDVNQQNAWSGTILSTKLSDYAGAAETDPKGDPQFASVPMSARNSRFGFSTVTPSDVGPIGVTVEGDFNGSGTANAFRLRHGYGTIGKGTVILFGQTWSTFRDGAAGAGADTVDWGGNAMAGGGRRPQIRATFDLSGATLAIGLENPSNDMGGPTQLPDVAANVNVPMDWGHVSLRGALVPLKTTDKSGMTYALALGGHVNLSGDTLILEVMAGSANKYMDFLDGNSILTDGTGNGLPIATLNASGDIVGFQAVSGTLAFTHLWTPTVRSSLILTGGFLKNDQDTRGAAGYAAQNAIQGFANVIYSVSKNAWLGLEFTYGQKADLFNNKYVLARVNTAAAFNFF